MENTLEEEWKVKVREELITTIDKFISMASTGGWGIKYQHPVLEQHEDGSKHYNTDKVTGVDLYIQFNFENTLVMVKE
jgi:hypothetical protein